MSAGRTPRRAARRGPAGEPRARKALGQHFLRDTGVLADIAAAISPAPARVIEIGAGTGQLTGALLAAGHEVVAIEIEPRLVRHLERRFADRERLTIVRADARELDLGTVAGPPGEPFHVAGNLPYFAANYIVRRLLEAPRRPASIVVMVQREVARAFIARPGHLSLLSVSIQVYAEPELLFDVPPEAFDPPPAVWSSVVRLTPRPEPLVPGASIEPFFAFVSRVFRAPRKQIRNALGMEREQALACLRRVSIDPARRPGTLTIAEWEALRLACAGDNTRA